MQKSVEMATIAAFVSRFGNTVEVMEETHLAEFQRLVVAHTLAGEVVETGVVSMHFLLVEPMTAEQNAWEVLQVWKLVSGTEAVERLVEGVRAEAVDETVSKREACGAASMAAEMKEAVMVKTARRVMGMLRETREAVTAGMREA